MKIIFLDIDGVLNHRGTLRPDFFHNCSYKAWDPKCVEALKTILDATGAEIVVTSSWRFNLIPALFEGFKHYGIKYWIGLTRFKGPKRGDEIQEYVEQFVYHPRANCQRLANYIILDDDNDMLPNQQDKLVQTSMFNGGLTMEHAKVAISILQDPDRYRRQVCMTERDVKSIKLLIESAEKRQDILLKSMDQYKKSKLEGFIADAQIEYDAIALAAVTARRFLERECQVSYYKDAKGIPHDQLNNPILPKVVHGTPTIVHTSSEAQPQTMPKVMFFDEAAGIPIDFFKNLEEIPPDKK